MAGLSRHPLGLWLKRLGRSLSPGQSSQRPQPQPRRPGRKARRPHKRSPRSPGTPRWGLAALVASGLILTVTIGLLAKMAFSNEPSPELAIKDRRPEQQADCEQLVKNKLLHPASYKLASRFLETGDDGAQRTFAWSFTSRTQDGATGKGSAVCKASNHLPMATIEVRQVE